MCGLMRFARSILLVTMGFALSVALFPAAALSAGLPVIESISVSHVTQSDATLEARIDPNGLQSTYQFELGKGCYPSICDIIAEIPLPVENFSSPQEGQSVSLDLNSVGVSLRPDSLYYYSVVATNAAGEAKAYDYPSLSIFTTPAAPLIESEAASNITQDNATLEARINPGEKQGPGAYYQFQVVTSTNEYVLEVACPPIGEDVLDGCIGTPTEGVLPIGSVASGPEGRSVSVDLAGAGMTLKPNTTYHYRVLAVGAVRTDDRNQWAGSPVYGPDQTFTTSPAEKAPAIESVFDLAGPSGEAPVVSDGGDGSAGSEVLDPPALETSSALGASSRRGATEQGGRHKLKHKHKRHGTKAAGRRPKTKKHKR